MNRSQICRMSVGLSLSLLLVGCRTKGHAHERDAADDGTADVGEADVVDAGDAADGPSAASDVAEPGSGVVLGEIGTSCLVNAECASGSCVDEVCCSSSMCGACQSCGLPATLGACAPLPQYADDLNTNCTGPTTCDGAAHCLPRNGQTCVADGACASGSCVTGTCCENSCGAECYSCSQSGSEGRCLPLAGKETQALSAAVVCAGTNTCIIALSGAPVCRADDGQPCVANDDCVSGTCRTYYFDGDRDGYGVTAITLSKCGVAEAPPAGYSVLSGDCCDLDKAAHPGVTAYYSTPDACGNFDYDCNGVIEKDATSCTGFGYYGSANCGQQCPEYKYNPNGSTQTCR
jgi:hypothetical protein